MDILQEQLFTLLSFFLHIEGNISPPSSPDPSEHLVVVNIHIPVEVISSDFTNDSNITVF